MHVLVCWQIAGVAAYSCVWDLSVRICIVQTGGRFFLSSHPQAASMVKVLCCPELSSAPFFRFLCYIASDF